jgi:hypothetical protein
MTQYKLSIPGHFSPIITAPDLAAAIGVLPRHLRPQVAGGWEQLNQQILPLAPGEIRLAFAQLNQRLRQQAGVTPTPEGFRESALWAEIKSHFARADDQDMLDECFSQALQLIHQEFEGDTVALALRELANLKSKRIAA